MPMNFVGRVEILDAIDYIVLCAEGFLVSAVIVGNGIGVSLPLCMKSCIYSHYVK
jgi:hypothetical protein